MQHLVLCFMSSFVLCGGGGLGLRQDGGRLVSSLPSLWLVFSPVSGRGQGRCLVAIVADSISTTAALPETRGRRRLIVNSSSTVAGRRSRGTGVEMFHWDGCAHRSPARRPVSASLCGEKTVMCLREQTRTRRSCSTGCMCGEDKPAWQALKENPCASRVFRSAVYFFLFLFSLFYFLFWFLSLLSIPFVHDAPNHNQSCSCTLRRIDGIELSGAKQNTFGTPRPGMAEKRLCAVPR